MLNCIDRTDFIKIHSELYCVSITLNDLRKQPWQRGVTDLLLSSSQSIKYNDSPAKQQGRSAVSLLSLLSLLVKNTIAKAVVEIEFLNS